MARTTALFFDVGGVLLTNGWDRSARRCAAEHFALDWDEFQDRHELVISDFETGRISLVEYLERTVQPRAFTLDEFKTFMLEQSQPYPEALAFIGELVRSKQYLLATLNNEFKRAERLPHRALSFARLFCPLLSACARCDSAQLQRSGGYTGRKSHA